LEIDLDDCKAIGDDAVTALISEGHNLRELRLGKCMRITDHAFLNLPYQCQFESLRILDLSECIEIQDSGVHQIINAAPRLRNVVLAKCRQLTDRAVMSIAKLGKSLHYIHLGHCMRITDAGVIALVRSCTRIRYIDLGCCYKLTDASVSHLASLPKLKRIGLVKCDLITDLSIYALARPRPAYPPESPSTVIKNPLERVHLSYCTNLTVAGITSLLINCPRLSHLSLTGVQAFLRDELLVLCREPPQEFTDHQRQLFCVFSNQGVQRLREHLTLQRNQQHWPMESDAGESDEMEGEGENFHNHFFNGFQGAQQPANPAPTPVFMDPIPPPPPPPHRRQSLPIHLTGATIATTSGIRVMLPPLQIPTGASMGPNGTPAALSPTHDAPLSVDEGEEFNEFPEPDESLEAN
jgi:F-box and leucine-rich repeat protein GRR1